MLTAWDEELAPCLYCPADPSFAVLRPGAPSFHLYGLGILVLLDVFVVGVFC